ncbi:MAG: hypothetical protein ACOY46_12830 [Bacillota bacterium]
MSRINWERLYGVLDNITPLPADCGTLCEKRCCSVREGVGIYLFPGEEVIFPPGGNWYSLEEYDDVDYYTGSKGTVLNCTGICEREKRPLACRLFPLAPYLDREGRLSIITDVDAIFICPLARVNDMDSINPDFIKAVGSVWEELLCIEKVREGVIAYSTRVDAQASDPWQRLFSR